MAVLASVGIDLFRDLVVLGGVPCGGESGNGVVVHVVVLALVSVVWAGVGGFGAGCVLRVVIVPGVLLVCRHLLRVSQTCACST